MFTIGVFAIILNKHIQILLSHRNDMDTWNLPGGGMKPYETPINALIREVKEETGLTDTINKIVALNSKPQDSEIVLTFLCEIKKGKVKLSDEADEHRWFSLKDLPLNTVPKQLERICFFFQNPEKVFLKIQNQSGTKDLLKTGKLEILNKKLLKKYLG